MRNIPRITSIGAPLTVVSPNSFNLTLTTASKLSGALNRLTGTTQYDYTLM